MLLEARTILRHKPDERSVEALKEQAARSLVEREDDAVRFHELTEALCGEGAGPMRGGPRC